MASLLQILKHVLSNQTFKSLTKSTTLLDPLSKSSGVDAYTLRSISGQLTCIILGLIFRNFLNRKIVSANFRHFYCLFFGIFIISNVFDYLTAIELLIYPVLVKVFIKFSIFGKNFHHLTLLVGMLLLSYAQYNSMKSRDLSLLNDVTLDISLLYMMMVQKLTTLAYSYHDGLVASKLSPIWEGITHISIF